MLNLIIVTSVIINVAGNPDKGQTGNSANKNFPFDRNSEVARNKRISKLIDKLKFCD